MAYKGKYNDRAFIKCGGGDPRCRLDYGICFFGEVPASELITGNALASQVGLTEGIAFNSNEPWLHFELDGIELYLAKKPLRYNVSWSQLESAKLIYGNTTILLKDKEYKVRLIKVSIVDPVNIDVNGGYDHPSSYGSEWNRLMYPIHSGIHTSGNNPSKHSDPYSMPFGTLAQYSDVDLHLHVHSGSGGTGSQWWGLNTRASNGHVVDIGYFGVTYHNYKVKSTVNGSRGWRPVLELIQE